MMRWLLAACLGAGAVAGACAEPPETEPLARGRQLFRQLDCGRCHRVDRTGGTLGPDLGRAGEQAGKRVAGQTAEEYLRRSIVAPGDYVVPGYADTMPRGLARNLSEQDLDALVRYLSSLR